MLSITNTVRGLFARPATPSRPRPRRRPLRLECLEERTLLCNPGELDLTFDGDGMVTTDFGTPYDGATDVAVQSDGRIVVGGGTGIPSSPPNPPNNFALTRYNTNGTLDTSFGNGGKVTTDFGARDVLERVAIQSDGKIIAAGSHDRDNPFKRDWIVARYNTNGTLDNSFGKKGKVFIDFAGRYDRHEGLAIQPDGKIVLSGRTEQCGDFVCPDVAGVFAVARLNVNGSLDTSFDGDGKATINVVVPGENWLSDDSAHAVAIQADGRILLVGRAAEHGSGNPGVIAVVRLNSNGSVDSSFGVGGQVLTDISPVVSDLRGEAVAIQTDGRIVVGGFGETEGTVFARYLSDGSLDTSFDTDGIVTFAGDEVTVVAIQADGKIIGGGGVNLVRLNGDGSFDTTFDTDGIVTGVPDASFDVQADGKIVAVGSASGDFKSARYCA